MPPTTFLAHLGLSRKLRAHGKDPLSRSAMANYRSTFIGTEPEEPGPLPRSRSAPCLGYAMPEASDAKLQEETLAEYVQQLSDRSQALQPLANPPELIEPEVPQDTLPATGHEMPASKAASVGSKGHPHFCCGPCRHFFRGECSWGGACSRCHVCQEEAKLDKRQRQLVASMDRGICLKMLATVMEAYATKYRRTDVLGFVHFLKEEARESGEVPSSAEFRYLDKVLQRYRFKQLKALALSRLGRAFPPDL
ncbi:unnamed protein product [Effrenium voratum]|uniref:C3H1-type domain-containing protein n=1 Tax=Effrenium voratum TaxID=2562239 RepID=A0AA36MPC4_9DINO|nr:unnamed protein product [Effrenium voratum]